MLGGVAETLFYRREPFEGHEERTCEMRFCFVLFCVTVWGTWAATAFGQSSTARIASGFNQPVYATYAPGDDSRLFVLEKDTGNIQIIDLESETVLDDPFLRVTGMRTGGERGLLGMAFHPEYQSNGKFYVYASLRGGPRNHWSSVLEYQVDGDPATSNIADASTRQTVMQFVQPFGNHNGGWIGFDPTAGGQDASYLYIATGDGGSANDPENNSQDITNNLLGKILRIDVDTDAFPDDDDANYGVPATNPFVGQTGDDEIWAYGLRNPWRTSFDRETGDFWIGDVGQGEVEEIDLIPTGTSGQNFGWRIMEGTECFRSGAIPCGDAALTLPTYEYTHGSGAFQGNSVTGGYFYRGSLDEFNEQYVFADFGSNNVWSLEPYTGAVAQRNSDVRADTGDATSNIASFAEDHDGELYIVGIGGSIYRLESSSQDATWYGARDDNGAAGDGVTFDDPNNWQRGEAMDTAFETGDHLIVAGENLTVSTTLRLAAVTFEADTTLEANRISIESGDIQVASGVTARLQDATLESAYRPGAIRKWGAGHLELDSDVRNGTLVAVEGSVAVQRSDDYDVQVEPGAVLDQSATGDISLDNILLKPDALLRIDTDSSLTANLAASGNFDVVLGEQFEAPDAGQTAAFLLLDFSPDDPVAFQTTTLAGGEFGHLDNGLFLQLEQDAVEGSVSLLAYQAIPGDANGDGSVGFDDFLTLSGQFGEAGDWLSGDFDANNEVDFEDFLLLSGNFGETAPATRSVPEPSSCWAWTVPLGVIALARRRRKRDA